VYKGWWIGVHEVAIKVFTDVNSGGESLLVARKALLREVALLKSCRSPYIVQVSARLPPPPTRPGFSMHLAFPLTSPQFPSLSPLIAESW
jgi:hypothetical protein